jgi:predicted Fe-Mo cluster-binding NifX family protein
VKEMSTMKVAVPVDLDQGLDSPASGHFGHCAAFVVSTIENGEVVEVHSLPNSHHSSCAEPVVNLAHDGVQVLIAHGMGYRPFMVTQQLGISVIKGQGVTAREIIDNYLKGADESFEEDSLCSHDSEHQHHH